MENNESVQYVDPEVTKIKFDREVQEFKELEDEYRKKGVISFKVTPLSIGLIFAVPHLKPHPIAFAVIIDYTNWDAEPPSIKFLDPFTEHPLKREEIKINFYQVNSNRAKMDLLQGQNETLPFFCIPGVKEYHDHAAHSGDSWMLYRKKGEGKLCVLIDQLHRHSIAQSLGYALTFQVNASVIGINTDPNKLKP